MIKNFKKTVKPESFYSTYINIMNGILKLTDKEKDIIVELLKIRELDKKIFKFKTSTEIEENVLNASNRQVLRNKLNISAQNLNNYIKVLKEKNVLIDNNGILSLSDKIVTDCETFVLRFTIEVLDEKDIPVHV